MTGSWFLQRGRADPIGPFTYDEVRQGLALGEIPADVLVREVSEAAWRPILGVPEFRDLVRRAPGAAGDASDAQRLAPVEGPAWTSRADRHVGRGGSGGSGGIGGAMASEPPAAAAKKAKARPIPPYVAPDPAHRALAAAIAALGLAWSLGRVALIALAPRGWRQLVGAYLVLRDAAMIEAALGVVLWPVVLFAVLGSGRRGSSGTPLVRTGALTASLAYALLTIAIVAWLVQAPGWSLETSKVALLATAVGPSCAFAAAAAWIRRQFPADPQTPATPTFGLVGLALAAGLGWLALTAYPEVVQLSPLDARADAIPTFSDARDLGGWLDGRREGVAGMPKVEAALRRALVVKPGARARVVQDVALSTDHGTEVLRLVELLDGEPGRRVYVPAATTLPR